MKNKSLFFFEIVAFALITPHAAYAMKVLYAGEADIPFLTQIDPTNGVEGASGRVTVRL